MKIPDIKKYIDLYGTENYLFKIIGPKVKERGYFLFEEFFEVCMWKSARQKQRYIENKDSVERISRNAFSEKDEKRKMEVLCQLKGVNVPMASALLTIVCPESYAVIDIRCLEMLTEMKHGIGNNPSIETWLKYLAKMREWAKENNVTPRELDMALYAKHKETQGYRNLYKKPNSKM
ncbi:MAG: hypothetical protein NUV47_01905 [Patescibacteria group bacterium]|nr:hypothetical protein [Patescibacteria group bacterium]